MAQAIVRPGKRRGTEVVEAFGTNWLVVRSVHSIDATEHEDDEWFYGVSSWGQQVAIRKAAAR